MERRVGFLVFSSSESVLMGTLLVPPWEGLLMLVVDWLGGDCWEVSGACGVEEMHVGLLGEAQKGDIGNGLLGEMSDGCLGEGGEGRLSEIGDGCLGEVRAV